MGETFIDATKARAAADTERFALIFEDEDGDCALVSLDPELAQRFVVSFLRGASAIGMNEANPSRDRSTKFAGVRCLLEIAGSMDGVWTLKAHIGSLTIPLALDQEVMNQLLVDAGRVRDRLGCPSPHDWFFDRPVSC
ncbi:MAG: hypothetical protein JWM91_583 [Rhodospirillales bacterium]|nr:hypothetical protein [Rhodospirillales bacterium]